MEPGRDNISGIDLRTGSATNLGELHQTSAVTEQGHGSTINSHLEARPGDTFDEAHPSALGNNSGPPSSLSSSQNPFLLPSDATNNAHAGSTVSEKVHEQGPSEPELHQPSSAMQQGNEGMTNSSLSTYPAGSQGEMHHSSSGEMLGLHSSLAPSANESSPGNPFHEPTNADSKAPFGAFKSSQNQPSAYETVPTNVESHHTSPVTEQGHQSMAVLGAASDFNPDRTLGSSSQEPIHNSVNVASKSQTDTSAAPKLGLDSNIASESSDDDVPISSMRKQGQSSDMSGQNSAAVVRVSNREFGTNNGSEIQNPPVQVMERPEDSATSSSYNFPSHVFARNKSNTPVEWSTASNESLFSIYMDNMSFSSELPCLGKSSELDKPGDIYMSDPPNAFPSNQPPNPAIKFNDISQRTAELHDGSKETEAKAAETMREVIMETSRTTQNISKGDLSFAHGANRTSNSRHHPQQSEGSTKSFAFKQSTDGDKSVSSKDVEEKQKQQETPDAAQEPQPTTDASPNRLLSCFPCCTFCH